MKTPRNSPTHIFTKPKFKKDCATKIMKPIPVKTITSNSTPLKISRDIFSNNKKYKIEQYILNQLKETVFSQEREIREYDLHQEEAKKQICCEEKEIESLKEQLNRI